MRRAAKRDIAEPAIVDAVTGKFTCIVCGIDCYGRMTSGRGKYCSATCRSEHFKTRYIGANNPNFRNAASKICASCGGDFNSYNPERRFCCRVCYINSLPLRTKKVSVRKDVLSGPPEACSVCGEACKKLGKKYCSMQCVGFSKSKGASRACMHCSKIFNYSPSSNKKFCSYKCFVDNGGTVRAGFSAAEVIMKKYGAKKDANHKEIMTVIKQFVAVHDLSSAGNGIPDGLAFINGGWQLFDIKNPNTSYGRRGLNKLQREWASDWRGGPVYLIYTVEEAQRFAKGDFNGLKLHHSNSNHDLSPWEPIGKHSNSIIERLRAKL